MTDDDKELVERDTVCAGDKPYTNGIRDLAEMPHVSEQLGNVFRDCARIIDERNDRIEALTSEDRALCGLADALRDGRDVTTAESFIPQMADRIRELSAKLAAAEADADRLAEALGGTPMPDELVEAVAKLIDSEGWHREDARRIARAIIPLVQANTEAQIVAWLRRFPIGFDQSEVHEVADQLEHGDYKQESQP